MLGRNDNGVEGQMLGRSDGADDCVNMEELQKNLMCFVQTLLKSAAFSKTYIKGCFPRRFFYERK